MVFYEIKMFFYSKGKCYLSKEIVKRLGDIFSCKFDKGLLLRIYKEFKI